MKENIMILSIFFAFLTLIIIICNIKTNEYKENCIKKDGIIIESMRNDICLTKENIKYIKELKK